MNDHINPETAPDELPAESPAESPAKPPAEVPAPEPETQPEPAPVEAPVVEPPPEAPAFDITHVKRVLEAALLASAEPLSVQQLRRLFAGQVAADNIRKVLDELKDEWGERSIELTAVASGWRFRVKPEYQEFIDRIASEKPPRYSRAVLETLAIVAYRQPVTRGDIEEIRGVAVSPPTLKALEERGWLEVVGHRETPGRPALFATTRKFLDDLNLRSLEELPPLEELQAALEPAPSLAPIEAATPPPLQETLIGEPSEEASQAVPEGEAQAGSPDEQEPQDHAG